MTGTIYTQFRNFANYKILARLASTLAFVAMLPMLAVPAARAQTFSVIHTFGSGEGSYPFSGITIKGGSLYGTTSGGGSYRPGSVYQISHVGRTGWPRLSFCFGSMDMVQTAALTLAPMDTCTARRDWVAPTTGELSSISSLEQSLCNTAKCFWTQNSVHDFAGIPTEVTPSLAT